MLRCKIIQDNPHWHPIIPSLIYERGLQFSAKALLSLSLFYGHLQKRCNQKAAPAPEYYRNTSKAYLRTAKKSNFPEACLLATADHHSKWEGFISESFV